MCVHVLCLQEIDGKALELLVNFMYSAEIHVTEENVQVFLTTYFFSITITRNKYSLILSKFLSSLVALKKLIMLYKCQESMKMKDYFKLIYFLFVRKFLNKISSELMRVLHFRQN